MATLPNPNPLTNNAVANYQYFVDPTTTVANNGANISNDVSTFINVADPQITKSVNKSFADVGDILTYTLIIKNSGNMTADNVIVTDTTPNGTIFVADSIQLNGVTQTGAVIDPPTGLLITSILPNNVATVTWNVTVDTLPTINPIPNSATNSYSFIVDPTGPITDTGARNSNIVDTQVNTANISGSNLTKSASPTSGKVGDIITYTIVMKNSGNVTANNVVFTDTIPNDTTFVTNSVTVNGVTQTGASPAPPTGVTIATIGPSTTATLTFSVTLTTLPTINPIPNEGKVAYTYTTDPSVPNGNSNQALTNIANVFTNQAVIDNTNGGGMIKAVDKKNAQVNDILTYTIGLTNTGNVTADNVVFTDTIPGGTSFVTNSVTVNGVTQTGASPAPPTGITVGTIGPSQTSTIVFQVTVTTIPTVNPIPNNSTVKFAYTIDPSVPDGASGSGNSNQVTTQVNQATIDNQNGGGLVKNVDKKNAQVNDTLTYTIVLKNTGNVAANNVVFTDTIPTDTTLVPNSVTLNGVTQSGASPAPPIGITVGTINAGSVATVIFKVTVNTIPNPNPIPNNGTVNYNFTIDSSIPNGGSGSGNTNTVNTQVNQATIDNTNGGGMVKAVNKAFAKVGDTLTYTITLKNTGNVSATNVIFKDTIPSGTNFVTNSVTINGVTQSGTNPAPPTGVTVGTIGPGSASTVTFQVTVTTIPSPNPIPNNSTVNYNFTLDPSIPNGGSGSGNSNTVNTQVNQATIDNQNGGGLIKSVDKTFADVNDTLTYTITLKNTGNVAADNVVFTDTIPSGTTFVDNSVTIDGVTPSGNPNPQTGITIGTISANSASTVVFKVTVTTIPSPNPIPNNGTVNYNYTVDPANPDGQSGSGNTNTVNTTVNNASFSNSSNGLVKSVDKTNAKVNDVLNYTLVLKNTGNVTANNIVLTDTIPSGTTFVNNSVKVNGVTQSGTNPAPPTGITIGSIAPSGVTTVTFQVTVSTIPSINPIPNSGLVSYTYTVNPSLPNGKSGQDLSNTVNTTISQATIDNTNGGGLVKAVDKAFAKVGDTLTYTIGLTNTGNVTADNVVFTDTIPNGTSFVTNSVTVNGVTQSGASPAPPTGVNVGNIGPSTTTTVMFQVTVTTVPTINPIPNNSTVKFTFTTDPANPDGNSSSGNSNQVTTQISQATIDNTTGGGLVKSVNPNFAKVNDTITYTVVLKNTGNVAATNVVFTDTIPTGTSFIANSFTLNGVTQSGADPTPPTGVNIGSIAPGGSSTVTFKVIINTIPSPNPIPNTATTVFNFTVDPAFPNSVTASGNTNLVNTQVNQAIINNATGGLVKSVDKTNASVGDVLTYTILVNNTGNTTANNIVFKDTIPSGTTFINNSFTINGVAQSGANPNPPSGVNIGNVGPGLTTTLTFQVTISTIPNPNPIPNSGNIAFTYTIDPSVPNGGLGSGNSNIVTTQVNQATIDNQNGGGLVKNVDKAFADVSDILTYTITLKNTGNVAANNINFTDTIPSGTTFVTNSVTLDGINLGSVNPQTGISIGTINAGQVSTLVFQVTVNTIPNPNPIPNSGTVNFTYTQDPAFPDGKSSSGNTNTVNTQVNSGNFNNGSGGIKKLADKTFAKVNDVITYTIVLTNTGNVTSNNIVITDTIPNNTTFVTNSVTVNGISQSGANPAPPTGVNVGSIAPSATTTLIFKVTVNTIPSPNPIPNSALASYTYTVNPSFPNGKSAQNLTNTVNTQVNQATIDNTNGGGMIKAVDKSFTKVGDTLTYTIGLTNTGNVAADNVIFTDTIPNGTAFVTNSVTVNGINQPGASPAPPTGINVGSIAPNATTTVIFQVTATTIPSPNPIPNNSTVKYTFTLDPSLPDGQSGSGNSNRVTTQVNTAIIDNNGVNGNGLNKSSSPAFVAVGDTINYVIVVKNTGNVPANNVVFTDTLPNGTTFVNNSFAINGVVQSGANPAPPTGVNIGTVNPSQVVTLTFNALVTSLPNPNPMPNSSTVNYTYTLDPSIPNGQSSSGNSNTVTNQVNGGFDPNNGGLVKSVDKAFAKINDILTYDIVINNNGNTTLGNILIKDTIPNGTSFVLNSVYIDGVQKTGFNPQVGISIAQLATGAVTTIQFNVKVGATIPSPNPIPNNAVMTYTYTVDPANPNGRSGGGISNTVNTQINSGILNNSSGGLVKAVDKAFANVSDILTYTINLKNTGNVTATNIVVTDTIPNGTTFQINSATVNGVIQPGAAPDTGISVISIGPGAIASVSFKVSVDTIPTPNPMPNNAIVNYQYTIDPAILNGGSDTNISNTVNTQVNNANFNGGNGQSGVNKSVDKAFAKVGDVLTYTIGLLNSGNVSANNVVFIDTIPTGTTFNTGSVTLNGISQAGANPQSGVNVGTVGPGALATIVFKVTVNTIPNPNPIPNTGLVNFTFTTDPAFPNGKSGSALGNTVTTQVNQATIDNQNGGGLIKAVDKAYAKVNDTLTYTITLKNTGNVNADNILFTDTIPNGTTFVSGSVFVDGINNPSANPAPGSGINIPSILAQGASTITFQVIVNTIPVPNPIPNRGTVKYNFTVDPSLPDGQTGSGNTNTVTTQVNTASIDNNGVGGNGLNKTVNPALAAVNDTLTYTIVAKNTGNVSANNVVITDTIPTDTTFVTNSVTVNGITQTGTNPETGINIGTLNPNQVATITFMVLVGSTIPNPNPVANTANVAYTFTMDPASPNGVNANGSSNVANSTINSAIINNTVGGGLVKSVSKTSASTNDILTYTISIGNTGNVTANNIIVSDTIPTGTTFVINSVNVNGVNQPAVNPQNGISIGNIGPGSISTLTFNVKINSTIPSPNPIPNDSRVTYTFTVIPTVPNGRSGGGISNKVNTQVNTAIINNATGGFNKAVSQNYADLGDVITYTLTLKNTGNTAANNVVVTDSIPNGTAFVLDSVTFNGTPQSGSVIAPPIGFTISSLNPNEVATITFKVTVTTIPSPNPIQNSATVNYVYTEDPANPNGASGGGNSNITPTQINNGGLDPNKGGFSKTPDKQFAKVSDTITYTSVLTNTGNVTINNVVFTDTIPNGTSLVTNSVTVNGVNKPGASPAPPTGINVGSIAPNVTTTVIFKVTVNTIPSPNPIPNTASASYTYTVDPSIPNGKPGNNSSNTSTTQVNQATIDNTNGGGLVKAVDKNFAQIGDVLNYTITLRNTGNVPANNVILTDTVPNGTSYVANSASVNGVPVSIVSPNNGIPVGIINSGSVSTVTFQVTVNTIPSPNPIPNASTVNYSFIVDTINSISANGSGNSNTVTTQVNQAIIDNTAGGGFAKTVDKAFADLGDVLTFSIRIKNTGNVSANNVIVTDTIPNGTVFVPGSVSLNGLSNPSANPGSGVNIGTIGPSATSTLMFKVTVTTIPSPNPIPNSATAGYTYTVNPLNPDGASGSGNTNITNTQINNGGFNPATGGIIKSVDKVFAKVNDTLTYTIALVNTGTVAVNNVVFIDTIPNGTIFIPNSLTVNGLTQLGANPQNGVSLSSITPGITTTIQFLVTVTTLPTINPIPNNSNVTYSYVVDPSQPSGKRGSDLSNTVNTQINDPFINPANGGLVKSSNKQFATIGDTITYTVAVKNIGNVPATSVLLQDTIPVGTSFVPGSVTVGGVSQPSSDPQIGVNLPQLLPGQSSAMTFNVIVTTVPLVNPIPNTSLLSYNFTVDPSVPNGASSTVNSNTTLTQINAAIIDNLIGGGLNKAVDLAYADIGYVLTYTIGVKNTGNVSGTNVIITDTIPQGTVLIGNSVTVNGVAQPGVNPQSGINVGTIGPSKSSTITFKVAVSTIPSPNPIPNTAISTYSFVVNPNNPVLTTFKGSSNTVTTQVNNGNIDFNKGGGFVKSVDKTIVKVGDTITYTLNLTNTGNVTVNNVVVTDTVPNGASFITGSATVNGNPVTVSNPQSGIPVGTIGPSQTSIVVFSALVNQVPSPNPMVNTATTKYTYTVNPASPNGVNGSGNSNSVSTGLSQAIIDNATGGFNKSVNKQFADVNDILTFTLVAKNTGTTTANNVVITDTIPNGTSFVTGSVTLNGTSQGSANPQNGINIGSLGVNQVSTVTFKVSVTEVPNPNPIPNAASISFTYTMDPNNPDGAIGFGNTNITKTQVNHGEISNTSGGLIKSSNVPCAGIGDVITYTILVRNTGNVTVNNVILSDTIPNATSFIQNSVVVNGSTFSGISPESGISLNSIPPQGAVTINFKVTVITLPSSANTSNVAIAKYNYTVDPAVPNGAKASNASNTVTTDVNSAIIEGSGFTKLVDKTFADLGDQLIYTLRLTNTGNTNAFNVTVFDTIPNDTTFVQGSVTVNGSQQISDNPQSGIAIGTIAPGSTVTVIYKVIINSLSLPNPNPIPNNADVVYEFETCKNVLVTVRNSSTTI
ncbi:DUF11 domain-containing protein [Clostridium botulinum]|nr:DUF11 domain-containing protein [Clostridium botulinum]